MNEHTYNMMRDEEQRESLLGEGESWPRAEKANDEWQAQARPHRAVLRPVTSWILLVFCFIEAFQVAFFVHYSNSRCPAGEKPLGDKSYQVRELQDYHNLREFKVSREFSRNETWLSATFEQSDSLWRSLLPHSAGIVSLTQSFVTEAGLPPSEPNPTRQGEFVYRAAMFHQLHCVNVIRLALRALHTQTPNLEISPGHEAHCIDYLRQGLLCNPDMTLLSTSDDYEFTNRPSDYHQCRDYDGIFDWMEQNRFKDLYSTLVQHNKKYAEFIQAKQQEDKARVEGVSMMSV